MMKKIILIIFGLMLYLSYPLTAFTGDLLDSDNGQLQTNPVTVVLNEKLKVFDTPPLIRDGRVLVLVRAIGEGLGSGVEWNEKSQNAVLRLGEKTITLKINDRNAAIR